MSLLVEDQLKEYFTYVDEVQRVVDIDRIIAEAPPVLRVLDDEHDGAIVGPSDRSPDPQPIAGRSPARRILPVAAASTAVVLVAGLVLVGTRNGGDPAPADRPEPPVTTDVSVDPLPLRPREEIDAGRYTTNLLGMDAAFDLPAGWRLEVMSIGDVEFATEDPLGAGIRAFNIARVGGWYTPEQAADPDYLGIGSIDPYAIETFLDANGVIAEQLPSRQVAGRPAKVFDWEVDSTSPVRFGCTAELVPCIYAYSVSPESFDPGMARAPALAVPAGWSVRTWVLVVDDFDPVVVFAWHWSDSTVDPIERAARRDVWFAEFESTILSSLELGPDGPPLERR